MSIRTEEIRLSKGLPDACGGILLTNSKCGVVMRDGANANQVALICPICCEEACDRREETSSGSWLSHRIRFLRLS